jgi:hypothetical protein
VARDPTFGEVVGFNGSWYCRGAAGEGVNRANVVDVMNVLREALEWYMKFPKVEGH